MTSRDRSSSWVKILSAGRLAHWAYKAFFSILRDGTALVPSWALGSTWFSIFVAFWFCSGSSSISRIGTWARVMVNPTSGLGDWPLYFSLAAADISSTHSQSSMLCSEKGRAPTNIQSSFYPSYVDRHITNRYMDGMAIILKNRRGHYGAPTLFLTTEDCAIWIPHLSWCENMHAELILDLKYNLQKAPMGNEGKDWYWRAWWPTIQSIFTRYLRCF